MKKPLIARQAVFHRVSLSVQRQSIGVIGCHQSGYVRNVLAQSLVTVHRQIGKRPILIELRRERLCRRFEVIEIPPSSTNPPDAPGRRTGCPDRRSCG